jgi:hypothetical protein
MGTCFCTGACMRGQGCAARGVPPTVQAPAPWAQVTYEQPLTEAQVRQIIREEIERAKA